MFLLVQKSLNVWNKTLKKNRLQKTIKYKKKLKNQKIFEFAKLRALRAKNMVKRLEPCVLTCLRPNLPYVLSRSRASRPCLLTWLCASKACTFTCSRSQVKVLKCQRALHAHRLTCQRVSCAYILTSQRALQAHMLACQHALSLFSCIVCVTMWSPVNMSCLLNLLCFNATFF